MEMEKRRGPIMTTTELLPHWDMSVVYPSLGSPEFAQAFNECAQKIAELSQRFDEHHVYRHDTITIDDALVQAFEIVVQQYNTVHKQIYTLFVYITCFVDTNSHDTLAQARKSELQRHTVVLSQLETRLTAWIGSLDVEALIGRSTIASDHAFALRKMKELAMHLMAPVEDVLASELNATGRSAWSKLYGDITSQLTVELEVEEQLRTLPMSTIRNMAYEADRDLRRRAYEAELRGWQRVAVPLAAAMNSIKGEVNTLARHCKWQSPLHASLFDNNIDYATLEAMLAAARKAFPDLRRYLHAKAKALHLEKLAWYDLFAPLVSETRVWSFAAAADFIVEQFGSFSSRLADFAARAFREQWIDAEPRSGKRDGAYCLALRGDESRIFANFKPSFNAVSTLAHELGHGYHYMNLAQRTYLQGLYPVPLDETASTFCETIICRAALQKADRQEEIAILEEWLQGACQIVVDIISRFLFEQRVFEKRKQRELSVDELNALMIEAQRETYGDGLDQEVLHPYMWAVKQHYYMTHRLFYNYPYLFGLLFGLGLYARYQQDPETFRKAYDDLLSSTGMADVATLAARFDIDVHAETFWTTSLDALRQDVARFEELTQNG
jgi:pepF/M3 family oligoendopeptidase